MRGGGLCYDAPVQRSAVGVVLAGGRSSRMGRDKALLPFGGKTLLEWQAATLANVAREVWVSGSPEEYARFEFPVISDSPAGAGPLAGIGAALTLGDVVVLAVDMPFVPAGLLGHLVATAGDDGALVDDGELFVPTAAYYRQGALPAAKRMLLSGRDRSLRAFTAGLDVRRLTLRETERFGPVAEIFLNINDDASYQRALMVMGRRGRQSCRRPPI